MPTVIAPSLSDGNIAALQKVAEISKPILMPFLTPGERLNVLVLGHSHDGKTILSVKDSTLLAESPLPLKSGETLTVQVDRLRPILVLRTISAPDHEISITNQFLKDYRSNPDALKEIIGSLKTLFTDEKLKLLSHLLPKQEIQNFQNILKQIVISEDNIANPLLLKDYIHTLGLTDEHKLMKAVSDPTVPGEQKDSASLKQTMMKLSAELLKQIDISEDNTTDPLLLKDHIDTPDLTDDHKLMKAVSDPMATGEQKNSARLKQTMQILPAELTSVQIDVSEKESGRLTIKQLSDFAHRASTVIESLQIVNVLAQEQDGLFMLQIPAQCPDGIRMQQIFIEGDGEKGKERDADKQCRVVLFLDMDSLGELAVDMGIKNATLNCTFKCQDLVVFDFLQPLLPALGQALAETDYKVGVIQCALDRDVRSWMQDFLQNHTLFTQNSIDLSI